MKRFVLLPVLALLVACGDTPAEPSPTADIATVTAGQGLSLVHHVSVGGDDWCTDPGCDANFSPVANEFSNGVDRGEWEAVFTPPDADPLHVRVDCLVVQGDQAWIGGVVTQSGSPRGGYQVGDRRHQSQGPRDIRRRRSGSDQLHLGGRIRGLHQHARSRTVPVEPRAGRRVVEPAT